MIPILPRPAIATRVPVSPLLVRPIHSAATRSSRRKRPIPSRKLTGRKPKSSCALEMSHSLIWVRPTMLSTVSGGFFAASASARARPRQTGTGSRSFARFLPRTSPMPSRNCSKLTPSSPPRSYVLPDRLLRLQTAQDRRHQVADVDRPEALPSVADDRNERQRGDVAAHLRKQPSRAGSVHRARPQNREAPGPRPRRSAPPPAWSAVGAGVLLRWRTGC